MSFFWSPRGGGANGNLLAGRLQCERRPRAPSTISSNTVVANCFVVLFSKEFLVNNCQKTIWLTHILGRQCIGKIWSETFGWNQLLGNTLKHWVNMWSESFGRKQANKTLGWNQVDVVVAYTRHSYQGQLPFIVLGKSLFGRSTNPEKLSACNRHRLAKAMENIAETTHLEPFG